MGSAQEVYCCALLKHILQMLDGRNLSDRHPHPETLVSVHLQMEETRSENIDCHRSP